MNVRFDAIKTESVILFFVLSFFLSACAAPQHLADKASIDNAYINAVKDAEIVEPREISRNLIAIVPSNSELVWKNVDDEQNRRILVATWTSYGGYDDKIGQSVQVPEVWVTTVPELKNFCTKPGKNNTLRIEQLLGLPPNAGKTKIVEMWVKPGDLYRPSPDPEISDHEAGTNYPMSDKVVKVTDDYVAWFNNLKAKSYSSGGYPWTRLGYTYDWGDDSDSHKGLSEFVIMKGSTVEVKQVYSNAQYCP